MKTIVTKSGKPILVSNELVIDYYKLLSGFIWKININEWMSNGTINGRSVSDHFKELEIVVWLWNEVQNDWIQQ